MGVAMNPKAIKIPRAGGLRPLANPMPLQQEYTSELLVSLRNHRRDNAQSGNNRIGANLIGRAKELRLASHTSSGGWGILRIPNRPAPHGKTWRSSGACCTIAVVPNGAQGKALPSGRRIILKEADV